MEGHVSAVCCIWMEGQAYGTKAGWNMGHEIQQSLIVSVLLTAMLFLLPLTALEAGQAPPVEQMDTVESFVQVPVEQVKQMSMNEQIVLNVLTDHGTEQMELEEYLLGVVRAEMPASFEKEALKAQAAAARTYTLHKLRGGEGHGDGGDVCTDSNCCQAYLDEKTAWENWGERAVEYEKKVADAVSETAGQVILYGGEPILAVFHSSSAGLTRPAGDVWSGDLPYLQAVASQEAGSGVPNYYSRVEFTKEEFRKLVLAAYGNADLSGELSTWLTHPETDAAGSVKAVRVGGISLRGTQLRSVLGLRSACFTWEVQGEHIVFFVTGYGHGVGLSQYGANQMAKNGADWKEILMHYYTGVSVGEYRFTNDLKT